MQDYQKIIQESLVEKLGDNLAKVRNASESAILAMCNHSAFGAPAIISEIVRSGKSKPQGPKTAKKALNSNKLIIGRYQTLARILAEIYNIPQDSLYQSLDFTVQGLGHAL